MSSISESSNQPKQEISESEPPACNTGVKLSHNSNLNAANQGGEASESYARSTDCPSSGTRIDWLSVTLKDWSQSLYPDGLSEIWTEENPAHSYDRARRFSDGRYELTHSSRADMGTHIQFSGEALEKIAETTGISDLDLLQWYYTRGAAIKRLDVALDAWNSGISLVELNQIFDDGEAITKVKKGRLWQGSGEENGMTLYIGSHQSEAFARFYDKAAEQGFDGDWLRFELELKDSKAESAAWALLRAEDQSAQIVGLIRGFVDFKHDEWQKLMISNPTVITRAKKTESDTMGWLLNQCAPSLARELVRSDDIDLLDQFMDRVVSEIKQAKLDDRQEARRQSLIRMVSMFWS